MARVTPHKDEVIAVVAALESPHETAEDAAKAAIKATAEVLGRRTSWVVLSGTQRLPVLRGPYWFESEATKKAEELLAGGLWAHVLPMTSVESGAEEGHGTGWCARCRCRDVMHIQAGTSRGKCVRCDTCDKYKRA